jgi:hypothetical protein
VPRKILRSQLKHYPFRAEINVTKVLTLQGVGTIVDQKTEWIFVRLDKNNEIIKTSIFIVDLLVTA